MTDLQNNCGSYHNLDCTSNLAAMVYDSRCVRCTKIKHVIALRRKGLAGAGLHEASAANTLAEKLVTLYKLTRGEILDREYAQQAITVRNEQSRRKSRSRKPQDEEIEL